MDLLPLPKMADSSRRATIKTRAVTTAPVLTFDAGKPVSWKHGNEFAAFQFSQPDIAAPLQKLDLNDAQISPQSVKEGAAVLLKLKPGAGVQDMQSAIGLYLESKAALIIVPEPADGEARFQRLAGHLPRAEKRIGDAPAGPDGIILKADQAQQLWGAADGTLIKLHAEVTPWQVSHTWNVLAKIAGKQSGPDHPAQRASRSSGREGRQDLSRSRRRRLGHGRGDGTGAGAGANSHGRSARLCLRCGAAKRRDWLGRDTS